MTTGVESPVVKIYFGIEYSPDYFTLDDPVKGELDNATYLIAPADGDGIDVSCDVIDLVIDRGRSREFDEFGAGRLTLVLDNDDRDYDDLNTAGTYFGDLVPGKRITVEWYGQMVYSGVIENYRLDWPYADRPVATIEAVDELGQLARKEFDEWTTTAAQTADQRIEDMLDRAEVQFGANRDLGACSSTLQSDLITWGSNALNAMQEVTRSEYGRLVVSREGVLTLRGRHALVGASSVVSFADDDTGVDFHGIRTTNGSEYFYNRVGVDREGGVLASVETDDAESQGYRSLSLTGLLMDSDSQSAAMAEFLLSIYSSPLTRVSELEVIVSALDGGDQAAVAALDITGDVVDVTWTPFRVGDPVEQSLVVEGLQHRWAPGQPHMMVIRTATLNFEAVFILDDAVWGVLDTGPGVLSF